MTNFESGITSIYSGEEIKPNFDVLFHISKKSPTQVKYFEAITRSHPPTANHVLRVHLAMVTTATEFGFDHITAGFCGFTHDIGKSVLDLEFIDAMKKNKDNFNEIKKIHMFFGRLILKNMIPEDEFTPPGKSRVMGINMRHHEIFGSLDQLYPRKQRTALESEERRVNILSEEDQLISKILAVCDVGDRIAFGYNSGEKRRHFTEIFEGIWDAVINSPVIKPREQAALIPHIRFVSEFYAGLKEEDVSRAKLVLNRSF